MKAASRCVAILVLAAGSVVAPAADQPARIWVNLGSPTDGAQVIGETVLAAEVVAIEEVRDVVFYVDGRPVGVLSTAPYRMQLDLGDDNRPRTIEVVATDIQGAQARHRIRTQPVAISAEYAVDLQQLYVTVTHHGEWVDDLDAADFRVADQGDQQKIVTFARGDIPFTAVLMIDSSASMYGSKLEAARSGATAFIHGMHELDQGKVMVFSDVIQNSTAFSSIPEVLAAGLIGATGQGGTAVNDALYASLKLLANRQGRRLVILLSDGVDTHSVLSDQNVLESARRSQAMVFWIRLLERGERVDADDRRQFASSWRTPDDYRRQLASLKQLVESSGGRVIPARSPSEIEPIFVEILRELRQQYALGYYPTDHKNDGSWRKVRVRVDRPGVTVRTHDGYLDY
jgi:VWFA-related protein